ncbi:MAG: glucose-6-phosphate isomerase [Sedimentisphaerales bacterium]|nr:glucose-6-phosphate isomerase [Sedimentisphaerales bacterium]
MPDKQIKFYYKNVLADVLGPEHGITRDQLAGLAKQTTPLIPKIKDEIVTGSSRYGLLPFDPQIPKAVKKVVRQFKKRCENLVVLGIGGSALGNIALQTALNPYTYNLDPAARKGPRLFVFDNVDPAQFGSFLDFISPRLGKTVFNVISKSGQTAETAAQFILVRKILEARFGTKKLKNHIVATTDVQTGALRKIATEYQLPTLEVPAGVGGRFSVLSAVGLFSAAMTGINIARLLAGAADMHSRVTNPDFYKNPAAVIAAIQYHFYNRGKRISVMFPYSYALYGLANWFRQLWAESLGKRYSLDGREIYVGPTPVKALGATDQHSQVQLYRQGPNDKVFTFLEVENHCRILKTGPAPKCAPELAFLAKKDLGQLLNAEKKATEYALCESNRPCLTVIFPQINAYTVGQFIFLYEATTSFAGALFGVNTYDQPAVELGKHAAFALMAKPGQYTPEKSYANFAQDIRAKTELDAEFII